MAGTISITGVGSGMDVNALVDALVGAASIQKAQLEGRLTSTNAASTSISDISGLLGKLKTAADALSTPERAQGYSVTASDDAISASVTTATSAGRYSVEVAALAQEYRAYSKEFSSVNTELGETGNLSFQVGTADPVNIQILDTDTLGNIVSKINNANAGVTATTLFDGTNYRLQLRSKAAGDDNSVTILEPVDSNDLGLIAGRLQQAQDAHIIVDKIDVYSSTNVVTGAIPGITLNLAKQTTEAIDLNIASDSSALKTKVQSFVEAYNAVIKKVHTVAGYGSTAASVEALAGNSNLRSLNTRMSSAVRSVVNTSNASYKTMYSIGITTSSDGTLSIDSSKFNKAVEASPEAVAQVMAGSTTTGGVMDTVSSLVKTFTNGSDGLLTNQLTTIKSNIKRLKDRIERQEDYLARYEERLLQQFSNMDTAMSASNSTLSYLSSYLG